VTGHCRRLAFFLFLFSCSFDISQPLLSSSIYNPPQTLTHESSSTIAYTAIFFEGFFFPFLTAFVVRPHITEGETRLGFTPAKTRGTTGSHHTCQRAPFNLVLYYIACCAYLFCLFSSSPPPFFEGGGWWWWAAVSPNDLIRFSFVNKTLGIVGWRRQAFRYITRIKE
jgi:hypothetical protein